MFLTFKKKILQIIPQIYMEKYMESELPIFLSCHLAQRGTLYSLAIVDIIS